MSEAVMSARKAKSALLDPLAPLADRLRKAEVHALISIAESLDILAQIEKKKWEPAPSGREGVRPGDDPGGPCE